ncbi:MAG: FmdB family transcriptional regulator [Actinobacteria bacterium]|nr:FmdB family transcriptional regulator [Actinomycetota bacterium]
MPTYEYRCTQCGTHIEVVQRFGEDPPIECGVCGGELRKVFHPAGILFKGSGFYKTDSRSAPSKTAAKADKADAKSASSESSKSASDTKKSDSDSSKKPDPKPAAAKEKTA